MFYLIRRYYKMGIYTRSDVEAFVKRGTITQEEYRNIISEEVVGFTSESSVERMREIMAR